VVKRDREGERETGTQTHTEMEGTKREKGKLKIDRRRKRKRAAQIIAVVLYSKIKHSSFLFKKCNLDQKLSQTVAFTC
jgi:hypothetical protein